MIVLTRGGGVRDWRYRKSHSSSQPFGIKQAAWPRERGDPRSLFWSLCPNCAKFRKKTSRFPVRCCV